MTVRNQALTRASRRIRRHEEGNQLSPFGDLDRLARLDAVQVATCVLA